MKIFTVLILLFGARLASGADPVTVAPSLDVLIVAPHPDDETIGCAGMTLQAVARRERVGIVVLTQGDGHASLAAVVAKKTVAQLGPDDFVRAGVLRQEHTLRAAASLGVVESDIMFLGYPDGGLATMYRNTGGGAFEQPMTKKRETYTGARRDYHSVREGKPGPYTRASVMSDLEAIIQLRRPTSVFVTHENDAHADHQAAFWMVRDALRAANSSAHLFVYIVHGEPLPRTPELRLTLSTEEVRVKRAALRMHQMGVSPVHDYLETRFGKTEELFWKIPPQ